MAIVAKKFTLTRPDASAVTYHVGQQISGADAKHWYAQHFLQKEMVLDDPDADTAAPAVAPQTARAKSSKK